MIVTVVAFRCFFKFAKKKTNRRLLSIKKFLNYYTEMTLCLEQEVHLARRGCWTTQPCPGSEFSNGAKTYGYAKGFNNKFSGTIVGRDDDLSVTNIVDVNNNLNNKNSNSNDNRKVKQKDTTREHETKTINQCCSDVAADDDNVHVNSRKCITTTNNSCEKVAENHHSGANAGVAPSQLQAKTIIAKNIVKSVSDNVVNYVAEFFSLLFSLMMSSMPHPHKRPQTTSTASHRRMILFVTVSCLLLTSTGVSARPNNMTAVAVGSTLPTLLEAVAPSDSSELKPIAEASLAAPVPTSDTELEVPPLHEVVKDGGVGHAHSEHVERFHVFKVDFAYVETPFIIGIWILFASIAKIGE